MTSSSIRASRSFRGACRASCAACARLEMSGRTWWCRIKDKKAEVMSVNELGIARCSPASKYAGSGSLALALAGIVDPPSSFCFSSGHGEESPYHSHGSLEEDTRFVVVVTSGCIGSPMLGFFVESDPEMVSKLQVSVCAARQNLPGRKAVWFACTRKPGDGNDKKLAPRRALGSDGSQGALTSVKGWYVTISSAHTSARLTDCSLPS